jgi:hypothetical protein
MIQTVPHGFWIAAGLLTLAMVAGGCASMRSDASRSASADTAETATCPLPPVDEEPITQARPSPTVGIPPLDAAQPSHFETATFALG